MAMNKFMHPRNPYKKHPNFKELAIKYPEFRKFAKTELSGRVVLDFKDQPALRALACTLLEEDFGLKVEIPLDRLIPTLPLRLNYLLWIEDLLEIAKIKTDIKGIDIGTGASCIYPLLAAKRKEWAMLATEIDAESAECASRNVKNNQLDNLISVKRVAATQLLLGVVDDNVTYHFSMCNPPFFSSEDERDSMSKSRSPSRTPPSNAPSGSVGEVVVQGGEVAFVMRMINESKQLGQQIVLYTSMLGHKKSVSFLLSELSKAGATSTCRTEFCQGNTTRWGIAWTFCPTLQLPAPTHQLVPNKKIQVPMNYVVPKDIQGMEYTVQGVMSKVKTILASLKMEFKELKENKYLIALEVTATSNTWSNQRRKRRQEKLVESVNGSEEEEGPSSKRPRLETDTATSNNDATCLLQAQLLVRKISKEVHLELKWSGGTSGRETLHQVLQYFKNHLPR
ncbi:hypothetical protein B566_EDAN015472 [Ephemera danica]|nr:hypothetical protein B566_EDAN015472 [Ephemera danica]